MTAGTTAGPARCRLRLAVAGSSRRAGLLGSRGTDEEDHGLLEIKADRGKEKTDASDHEDDFRRDRRRVGLGRHGVHVLNYRTLRRERLFHPHSQFYFWRTAAGSEIDLVIERGPKRFGVEVKSGRGGQGNVARRLEQAARDTQARRVWILDQAEGAESLRPGVERLSWPENIDWLPE